MSPKLSSWGLIFLSLSVVALGQPARFCALGALSAVMGFSLFFYALSLLPSISLKKKFLFSALWFAGVQATQLSWMLTLEFQGYYILVVYAFLLLCLGAQFGLLAIQVPLWGKLSWKQIFYFASFWTLMEWIRLFFFCGFSWNPVGLALSCSDFSLQLASVAGVFGLSFWVMLTNGIFLNLLRGFKMGFAGILCALIPYAFGAAHLYFHSLQNPQKTLHIALVQTALLPSQKAPHRGKSCDFIPPMEQWRQIASLLKQAQTTKWDRIVLPEAAVFFQADETFYPLREVQEILASFFGASVTHKFPPLTSPYAQLSSSGMRVSNLFWSQTLSNVLQAEMVVGFDYKDKEGNKNFNSAFYLKPNSSVIKRYDKQILLPLAESLPFSFLKLLTKHYGITDFFTEGGASKVWEGLSPSICYEETFPALMRQARLAGAKLFVNLTNDNYYPHSLLHKQHLFHARLRAIENGIPLIRSCNAGVSAVIDSLGRIVAQAPASTTPTVIAHKLNTYVYPTLFSLYGDKALMGFSLALCLIFWVVSFFKLRTQTVST